jgi:hypothetical protein
MMGRSRMAVGFELRVGRGMPAAWGPRKTCRFPFIRGKEDGECAMAVRISFSRKLQMGLWTWLDGSDTAHRKLLVLAQHESQSTGSATSVQFRFSSPLSLEELGVSATDPISVAACLHRAAAGFPRTWRGVDLW